MSNRPLNGRWKLEQALSMVAAGLIFMLVFALTGDSDILFAIGSGLGVGLMTYVVAQLNIRFRDRRYGGL